MNYGKHSYLASDARASLARAANGEHIYPKAYESRPNPLTIIQGGKRKPKFNLTDSTNMMDVKIALKVRDNQMEFEDGPDSSQSSFDRENGDSNGITNRKNSVAVSKLDLTKLKGKKMEDVDLNINLAKTLNQTSDIFQSRSLKLDNKNFQKRNIPPEEKTLADDLALDIKNLSKLNLMNPEDFKNNSKMSK